MLSGIFPVSPRNKTHFSDATQAMELPEPFRFVDRRHRIRLLWLVGAALDHPADRLSLHVPAEI